MTEITFHSNGRIHTIINTKNGIRHGTAKTFFPNGRMKAIMNFCEGELRGESKEFYPDGSLAAHSNITNDNKAFYKSWYLDGTLELDCKFIDDKLEKSVTYFQNGKIKTVAHYINKLRESICEEYYETGSIKYRDYYHEDVKDGMCEEFYENGQVKMRALWKNGSLNMSEVEYYTVEGERYLPKLIFMM